MTLTRYLQPLIRADLDEKMVLVAGPRQVGKTTLVKQVLAESGPGWYGSWDNREDRREMLAARWPGGDALIVLDELHKYRFWKRWLKGEFDKHRDRLRFLVTGSARLEVYRRGGDSLQGRYHHYRLHPLSLGELEHASNWRPPSPGEELVVPTKTATETMANLLRFGGFPEPFLAQSERTLRRWQKERLDRFFREDVRDLEAVRDLSLIELLADMLSSRVASPLSVNTLRQDLEVSHKAVTHWIDILERLYHVFLIRPFESRAIRGLKKMPKAYFWDMSLVQNEGPRFENLIALHLLKLCTLLEDAEGYRVDLFYLKDSAGREVDFLVCQNHKPWFAVEAKLADAEPSKSLLYFKEKLHIPFAYQVLRDAKRDFVKDGIRCLPADRFLGALV